MIKLKSESLTSFKMNSWIIVIREDQDIYELIVLASYQ